MRYVLLTAAVASLAAPTVAVTAPAKIPKLYSSCKQLNMRYPHGIGRYGAHDKTTGAPVTNFFHSTRSYNLAMTYNRGLDRDHDGIACEKQ